MEGASDSPRPRKVPRTSEPQRFRKGTVIKMRVHNFMSYADTVTISPGPRLNLVIGPNGTGKSSLVCALCVGLGGSTKLLGRADNLADFVRGQTTAPCWTEITLSGGGEGNVDYVVRHDIKAVITVGEDNQSRRKYSSDWKVNGQDRSKKCVQDLVKGLGIQFDNLCQFLPQDKVVEFSNMNKFELLEATEKAIGDGYLHRTHQDLIKHRGDQKEMDASRAHATRDLEKLRIEHQKQQRDYDRFQLRQELAAEINKLHAKQAWLRVNVAQMQVNECKNKKIEAEQRMSSLVQGNTQDEEPMRNLTRLVESEQRNKTTAAKEQRDLSSAVDNTVNQITDKKRSLEDLMEKRAQLGVESQRWATYIKEKERDVEKLRAQHEAAPEDAPAQIIQDYNTGAQQLDDVVAKRSDLEARKGNLIIDMRELETRRSRVLTQENRLRDSKMQRLKLITQEKMGRGVQDVYEWVQANKAMFECEVLGPVGLEITCNDKRYAGHIEQNCWHLLFNFLTRTRKDEEALSAYIKERGYQITVKSYLGETTKPLQYPFGQASTYRHLGVACTMDDAFDAPPLVKHILSDWCNITKVFVCEPQVTAAGSDNIMNAIPRGIPGQRVLYTKDQRRALSYSAYNPNSSSTAINDAQGPKILVGSQPTGDDDEQARLQSERAQLEQSIAACAQEIQRLDREDAAYSSQETELTQRMKALDQEIKRVRKIRPSFLSALKATTAQLEVERKKPDPRMKNGPIIEDSIKSSLSQLGQLTSQMVDYTMRFWDKTQQCAVHELSLKEAQTMKEHMQRTFDGRKNNLTKAQKMVQDLDGILQTQRQQFKAAKQRAESLHPMNAAMKELLQQEPREEAALQELIELRTDEMDSVVADDNVVAEYQARQRRITSKEQELAELEIQREAILSGIEAKKALWLPEMRKLVHTINISFETNFKDIGCAGEVSLKEDEDYDKCAIEIKVTFREGEEMHLLTSKRQSGGERSVATILYLIALQGVTDTPFRVVDEINQGMDAANERKVFELLVQSSCKPDTPQCFLLTPKLLAGLTFNRDITVLIIMNGPHLEEGLPKAFNKKKMLYGERWNRAQAMGAA